MIRRQVLPLLFTLWAVLPTPAPGQEDGYTETEIGQAIDRVFEQPEFSRYRQDWTSPDLFPDPEPSERAPRPSKRRDSASGDSSSSDLGELFGLAVDAVVWGIAILLGAVCLFGIVTAIFQSRRRGATRSTASAPEARPDDVIERAPASADLLGGRQSLDRGDLGAALRELFLAMVGWIESRELLRPRPGHTTRDYLRALNADRRRRDVFRRVASAHEATRFGRRTPSREQVSELFDRYEEEFQCPD